MALFTSTEIDEELTLWKAAFSAVSQGQEFDMGGEKLTRAHLPEIRRTLKWLYQEKTALSEGLTVGPQIVTGRPAR